MRINLNERSANMLLKIKEQSFSAETPITHILNLLISEALSKINQQKVYDNVAQQNESIKRTDI
jgi:hypothetical protein